MATTALGACAGPVAAPRRVYDVAPLAYGNPDFENPQFLAAGGQLALYERGIQQRAWSRPGAAGINARKVVMPAGPPVQGSSRWCYRASTVAVGLTALWR